MWALFSRRLRRRVLVAVGVPVLAWVVDRVGDRLEAERGETPVTRTLRTSGQVLRGGRQRGAAAPRRETPPPEAPEG